jgi:hypothetical protein
MKTFNRNEDVLSSATSSDETPPTRTSSTSPGSQDSIPSSSSENLVDDTDDSLSASETHAATTKIESPTQRLLIKKSWVYLVGALVLFLVLLITGSALKENEKRTHESDALGGVGDEDISSHEKKDILEDDHRVPHDEDSPRSPMDDEGPSSSIAIPLPSRPFATSPPELPAHSPSYHPTTEPSESPITQSPSTQSPSDGPSSMPTDSPITEPTNVPTSNPSDPPIDESITYRPGNLIRQEAGLLLSEGLAVREIATSGQKVAYGDGSQSKDKFHDLPDGGETFADSRQGNEGGWIYVSNSEMSGRGEGGVGAITFDRNGDIFNYEMVLEKTTMNCGGGATPWNTWVSCEELEFDGQIYQVDPTGEREAQLLTLGNEGGRWEAFAFDVRDRDQPRFFVSEDHNRGAVRQFTPQDPNWENPWDMLHGNGVTEFLILTPDEGQDGGTFEWSNDKEAARNNARLYYPQTEGIDCHESQLFFVCKNIRQIFTVNLDEGTYTNATTVTGLFDGKPDQMQRILDDPNSILYFTEEGGKDAVSSQEGVSTCDDVRCSFSALIPVFHYFDTDTGRACQGRNWWILHNSGGARL